MQALNTATGGIDQAGKRAGDGRRDRVSAAFGRLVAEDATEVDGEGCRKHLQDGGGQPPNPELALVIETPGELLDRGLHIGPECSSVLGYQFDVPAAYGALRPTLLEVESGLGRFL